MKYLFLILLSACSKTKECIPIKPGKVMVGTKDVPPGYFLTAKEDILYWCPPEDLK